jgi:chromate transport protein ChrA
VPYLLPGVVIAFVLSALAFSVPHPSWVEGALAGFGAAALGLLFATTFRSLSGSRTGRFGILFATLAFLAHGILGLDLLLVLFGIGLVSLLCNRPKGGPA